MKRHRIASVEATAYPTVRITFEDGLAGAVDVSRSIAGVGTLARLRDADFFRTAAVGEGGRSFGWDLGAIGREIDVCADAARIGVETGIVEAMAERYAAARPAAA